MHWALIFGRMLHALCAFCSYNKNLLYIYFPSQGRSRRVFWYNITFAGWKSAHRCDNMFSMIFGSCQRSHIAPVHRLFARTLFSRLRSHVYMTILFFYDEKKTCLPVWIWMDRLFSVQPDYIIRSWRNTIAWNHLSGGTCSLCRSRWA